MNVVQIAGFLGSGKTTTLIALSRQLSEEYKKRVAIIVNEIGDVPVDAKVVNEFGLKVKDIGGAASAVSFLSTWLSRSRSSPKVSTPTLFS